VLVRYEGHQHHAIDTLIVAAIGQMPLFKQLNRTSFNAEGIVFDTDTGEILDKDSLFDNKSLTFISQSRIYENQIKYSHKVDRKPNRSYKQNTGLSQMSQPRSFL